MTDSQRAAIAVAVTSALVLAGVAVGRPGWPIRADWPPQAVAAVTKVLDADPHARVIAGYQLGDWLLFEAPELKGRIAFDGRWEILSRAEFLAVIRYFGQATPEWQRPSKGYRLVVLNPAGNGRLVRWYDKQPGAEVVYRSARVVVFDRGPDADAVGRRASQ